MHYFNFHFKHSTFIFAIEDVSVSTEKCTTTWYVVRIQRRIIAIAAELFCKKCANSKYYDVHCVDVDCNKW